MHNNCKQVKLGDITTYNKGYAFNSKEYTDEGTMVVRVSDFTEESISDENAVYIQECEKYEPYRLTKNNILIQTVGSWANNPNSIVGKVVRVPQQCHRAYLNQNIVRIIPKEEFDNNYLYYALKANKFPYYCVMRGQGAANQASITLDTIFRFKFKIHDTNVQKKIADVLSAYDDLIENNNKRIELLENMAQELYKEWFIRFRFPGYEQAEFENGIPKGWEVDKIKNRVNRLPFNKLYKESDLEKEGNVIVIDQSEKEFLGFHNNEPSHVASYNAPICLFGDHSCKFQFMTESFSLGENVVPFKGNNIEIYYLYYATHEIIKTEEYKRHWNLFISKKILIPPKELQQDFSKYIENIKKQKDILIKCNRLLIKQRDLLLPRLMGGKLEV